MWHSSSGWTGEFEQFEQPHPARHNADFEAAFSSSREAEFENAYNEALMASNGRQQGVLLYLFNLTVHNKTIII